MRKGDTPIFKALEVQERLKEEKALTQQLAAEHGVHLSQFIAWRATALQTRKPT